MEWMSSDNYQEYYTSYLGKETEDLFEDKEFRKFVNSKGLYFGKEVPLNHSIDNSLSRYEGAFCCQVPINLDLLSLYINKGDLTKVRGLNVNEALVQFKIFNLINEKINQC